jgi:hypothetical protein
MAIAPIDLQTLFTQLDKVGRTHASQKEGQAIQQAVQSVQIQRKTEEMIKHVNETQNTGEGAEKVNDHGQRKNNKNYYNSKGQKEDDENETQASVLRDPSLGRTIDISL